MMPQALAVFLFETSPWDPVTTALLVGFAVLAFDGTMYLTASGEEYLNVQDAH